MIFNSIRTECWASCGFIKDIDVTDHGRPAENTNPHQHRWIENETGGTMKRGAPEPVEDILTNKPKHKG